MSERTGLTQLPDADSVALEIVQTPWVAWLVPYLVGVLALAAGGSVFPPLLPIWGISVVIGVLGLTATGLISRRLSVDITPTEVHLKGFMGRLPIPARHTVPLVGTTFEWHEGTERNVQMWVLTVRHEGEVVAHIPSLRCTEAELVELRTQLEAMRERARQLQGEGEDEVPAELQRMVQAQEQAHE